MLGRSLSKPSWFQTLLSTYTRPAYWQGRVGTPSLNKVSVQPVGLLVAHCSGLDVVLVYPTKVQVWELGPLYGGIEVAEHLRGGA